VNGNCCDERSDGHQRSHVPFLSDTRRETPPEKENDPYSITLPAARKACILRMVDPADSLRAYELLEFFPGSTWAMIDVLRGRRHNTFLSPEYHRRIVCRSLDYPAARRRRTCPDRVLVVERSIRSVVRSRLLIRSGSLLLRAPGQPQPLCGPQQRFEAVIENGINKTRQPVFQDCAIRSTRLHPVQRTRGSAAHR